MKIQVFTNITLFLYDCFFYEDKGTILFRNVGYHWSKDTVSHLGRQNPDLHFTTDFTDREYWNCWRLYNPDLILRSNEDSKESQL
jgi:hypothetical protein